MEHLKSSLFFFCCCILTVGALEGTYNVYDYGAVGDGQKDDTQAFLATWEAACAAIKDSTFLVPNGKTFLVDRLKFRGPCKSPIHIRVDGNILRPRKISAPVEWINFSDINGLTIDGSGQFDAQGELHWPCKLNRTCANAPNTMLLRNNTNVVLSGLTFINSGQMHLVVGRCNNVVISHVNITAPGDSPNTDGIHIQRSQNVEIQHSTIGTGDDCISIETGAVNVVISDVTCGPGHGISIGSLGEGGSEDKVEKITVKNSKINGATNGVRIKTWQGGSGYAKDILFQNISLVAVQNPIIIDQFYFCQGCQIMPSAVKVSNVKYIDITGTSATDVAINIKCSESVPCEGIEMYGVNIQPAAVSEAAVPAVTAYCQSAQGYKGAIVPDVPCLTAKST